MFSWLATNEKKQRQPKVYENVWEGLSSLYSKILLPLETQYQFHEFYSPPLGHADFNPKPMILLLGEYSTGKTTFIKYLLEQDFPGSQIGPEPTTDRFMIVMHDEVERIIPGNAVIANTAMPFQALSKFGNAFLNRFQCSLVNNPVLEALTIIDTPGVITGSSQQVDRGYDYEAVVACIAERVDRILIFFDAHKTHISEDLKRIIFCIQEFHEKIGVVLNKADTVSSEDLIPVHGSLLWALGQIIKTPAVPRVYIGSFWDKPLQNNSNRNLFNREQTNLFRDLQTLTQRSTLQKLSNLMKRARLARAHAFILSHLKMEMPMVFGKDSRKQKLIRNLGKVFKELQKTYRIPAGDFPAVEAMREKLQDEDFSKFSSLKLKLIYDVDLMLSRDVIQLMNMIPKEECNEDIQCLAFKGLYLTPFGIGRGEGLDVGMGEKDWVVRKQQPLYDTIFESLCPLDGLVSGYVAKKEMVKSHLPDTVLGRIWNLVDIEKNGMLDREEFSLAMYLIQLKLDGHDIPEVLPEHLIPPSKSHLPLHGKPSQNSTSRSVTSTGLQSFVLKPAASNTHEKHLTDVKEVRTLPTKPGLHTASNASSEYLSTNKLSSNNVCLTQKLTPGKTPGKLPAAMLSTFSGSATADTQV